MSLINQPHRPEEVKAKVISIHVPKTAGTTFKQVLKQIYNLEEIFFDYPNRGRLRNKMLINPKPEVKVIHGHFPSSKYDYKFPEFRKIIWLRDPIKRLISLYFFWKTWQILLESDEQNLSPVKESNLTFIEFAEKPEMQNVIKSKFVQEQKLTEFDFVGIQEFFPEDLHELKLILNWPDYKLETQNTNPYPGYKSLLEEVLSNQEIVDKISTINDEDIELYREAVSLRETWRKTSKIQYYTQENLKSLSSGKQQITQKTTKINPLLTWGSIDRAVIQNQVLHLSGWVASLDAGMVEGFKVVIGNQVFSFFEQTLNIPSPDVEKLHPNLDSANNARFRLKILLNQQQINQLKYSLITLTPQFKLGEGIILLKVLTPLLPLPEEKDIKIIDVDGSGEFIRTSFKLLGDLIQRLGLQHTDHILDVGCNIGTVAYALVHYLQPSGRYEGFDIVKNLISSLQKEITTRKPNFNFYWHNIHHPLYNPTGKISAINFTFPYPDESFNCVCISHLLIHLQSLEVMHYLDEIYRVLKLGGRCLLICFLINSESEQLIAKGKSSQQLIYEIEDGFTKDIDLPERGIGFRENLLLKWINERGFNVLERSYGSWCGRTSSVKEDLLILEKK
ncbi:MAG: methyltransferase domain-containing protein [Okeania sp. SIO2G4]|uniref:sulfotransferase family 2 domain-containing protein n=1 Tax=unclassified Okeania TaxID=2634635 RepID=UPI0013B9B909|nr:MULTISPECIES: sulfotransferase family 2 domain-containing protein [unclassified Okeania]NEP72999.1 methyltransferase domain-containing protein [Okeania sp. SIO2G5]NEP93763.1 methyltransferase domain-containing protein [Okeania sp. SIO2F5]NEQ91638.1 methyltransferase domain-containing protein [Okeania sp. SIO2G4]